MPSMKQRIINYWTERSENFANVRRNELADTLGRRWEEALLPLLPSAPAKILDVGTGAGFFAILLAKRNYAVTGIDLTPAMLEEARNLAASENVRADFLMMDAQRLDFPDHFFDSVITRNLTWTLPDVPAAYAEWFRVLSPGGVLLNFDANYGRSCQAGKPPKGGASCPYGHQGLTPALERENEEITLAMPIHRADRPAWDAAVLKETGFIEIQTDEKAGAKILRERDLPDSPLFLIRAKKPLL